MERDLLHQQNTPFEGTQLGDEHLIIVYIHIYFNKEIHIMSNTYLT